MSQRNKRNTERHEAPHAIEQDYGEEELIRLNKYIAHCGYCSRRKADNYIAAGKVQVNNEVCTQMGVKVQRTDQVTVEGEHISLEKFVYILLNKPKDTITTTDDPRNRDTVMDKIEDATGKRVYPVGRLDRHTMGLLLLTNDGDLANRLMHPSYEVRKVYEVETRRKLSDNELKRIAKGIALEDRFADGKDASRTNKANTLGSSACDGPTRFARPIVEHSASEPVRATRDGYPGPKLDSGNAGRWPSSTPTVL